jgi:hypothetical protein
VDSIEFKTALERIPEVRLVILFGSWAIGKATTKSDVDVAVSLEPDTPEVRCRVEAALRDAVRRSPTLDGRPRRLPGARQALAGLGDHESSTLNGLSPDLRRAVKVEPMVATARIRPKPLGRDVQLFSVASGAQLWSS